MIENISEKAVAARDELSNLIDRITAAEAEEITSLYQFNMKLHIIDRSKVDKFEYL